MSVRQPTATKAAAGAAKGGASASAGIPLWYLLPLRMFLGWTFLRAGMWKLGPYLANNELRGVMARWASDHPHAFVREFLGGRGQLWSELLGYVVTYGEIAIGVALLLGLFTRGAAVLGTLLVTCYLVAGGHTSAAVMAQGQVMLVALLTLAAAGAGRTIGCDGWLHKRAPVMPFTMLY